MLQLRMTLLFFVLTGLVFLGLCQRLEEEWETALEEDVLPTLKAQRLAYEALTMERLRDLDGFAQDLEYTDLPVYLSALEHFRGTIQEVGARTRAAFPGVPTTPSAGLEQEIRRFVTAAAGPALDEFRRYLDQEIRDLPADITREKYLQALVDILVSCIGEKDAWDVCSYKLTLVPLAMTILDGLAELHKGGLPHLFVLVDADGQTTRLFMRDLQNRVGGGRELDLARESPRYREHKLTQFNRYMPQLADLANTDEKTWSTLFVYDEQPFLAIAHKLRGPGGALQGFMVVGYEVDSVLAKQDTRQVLGVRPRLEKCEDFQLSGSAWSGEFLPAETCAEELQQQVGGVTYLYRGPTGSAVVAGSSLSEGRAEEVARLISRNAGEGMLTGEDYLVGLVEIGLDYTLPGERLTAVLSLDREDVEAGWSRLGQWNVGAGILLALLGTILLAWTLRSIRRPYEEIDAAVHGIILGDVHARIPFEFSEPQARSLGQSLSLMQSVLLGEPLPEEQEASSAWGRDLVIAAEEGSGGAASGHETVREEDMTESRDAYFQRLFGEFVAARRALGENPSTVSMGTFVERVVRTEMGLRKRLHCKAVRFRVEVKNGQVALVPIRVE